MRVTNEKVYRCDYCNRGMISKGAMTVHERTCRMNPNNQHACFKYCISLNKDTDHEGFRYFYCGNNKCKYFHKDLYSYKLERNKHMNADRIKSMTRMPLECEQFQIEEGHDDDYLQQVNLKRQ